METTTEVHVERAAVLRAALRTLRAVGGAQADLTAQQTALDALTEPVLADAAGRLSDLHSEICSFLRAVAPGGADIGEVRETAASRLQELVSETGTEAAPAQDGHHHL